VPRQVMLGRRGAAGPGVGWARVGRRVYGGSMVAIRASCRHVLPFNPPQIRYARRWPSSERHGSYETFGSCPFIQRGSSPAQLCTGSLAQLSCDLPADGLLLPALAWDGRVNCNRIRAEVTGCSSRLIPRRPLYSWSCLAPAHGIIEGEQAITRRTE
jgi:hypothetical protein